MNTIDTSQLLQQIRTLGKDLQPIQPPSQTPPAAGSDFGDMLKTTLHSVSQVQAESAAMKSAFLNGSGDKSLAEVMVASQKANLGFRAVTEVRNKLVTAYQDIMNMPV